MRTAASIMSRCITLSLVVALMGCGESGQQGPSAAVSSDGSSVSRGLAKRVLNMTAEESAAADQQGITTAELVAAAEATDFVAKPEPPTAKIPGKKSVGKAGDSPELIAAQAEVDAAQAEVDAAKVEVDAVKADPVLLTIAAGKLSAAAEKLSIAADKLAKLLPPDVTIPTITSFVTPLYSNSLTIPVRFTVWDNVAVTGYLITSSGTVKPAINDPNWSVIPPTSYVAPAGTLMASMWLWVKDPAGNLSWPVLAMTNTDITPPKASFFMIPATAKGLTIPISFLTASDNFSGLNGYIITEDAVPPSATDARWNKVKPASYTTTIYGAKRLYIWVRDVAGNVSVEKSAPCTNNP